MYAISYFYIYIYIVELLNADTFGTKQNCPDYQGVHISGIFCRKCNFKQITTLCVITFKLNSMSVNFKCEVMLDCTEQLI